MHSKKNTISLQTIIEKLPGHVWWKDKNLVYLGCNDRAYQVLGLSSRDQYVGKTDDELWDKQIADKLKEVDLYVLSTGEDVHLEEIIVQADGRHLIMLTNKSPLYDEKGDIVGVVGTSTDITDRKEAEAREKAALLEAAAAHAKAKVEEEIRQAVMVLAGSIAHDIRTPLTTLRLICNEISKCLPYLLKDYYRALEEKRAVAKTLSPLQLKILDNVSETFEKIIDDMNLFIKDTLKALSRVVSGTLSMDDLVLCSSEDCLYNALDQYPFEKEERTLVKWDRHHSFHFLGNPVLFFRIIFNLMQNALYQIHKNDKGQILISSEDGGDCNILRIRDTAGGVSPEVVAHFFDAYRTTKQEGTGLGLAFCKLTMKSFGGDIACHSIEGDYIEFVLTFPKVHGYE